MRVIVSEHIVKKLRLQKFQTFGLLKNAKEDNVISTLPFVESDQYDCLLAFTYRLEDMESVIEHVWNKQKLISNGVLYLIYPKLKNTLGHEPIHRDSIFPYLKPDDDGYFAQTTLKFNLMVALDDNYTVIGLKNVAKKIKTKSSTSQSVDDYIQYLPQLESFLLNYPAELQFFKSLTYGYQKDWARYVYSAKTISTQDKRKNEMVELLAQKYKTKNLYLQSKRNQQ